MELSEFERLARLTRLSERGREAVRRVLVSGESQADVARDLGVHRQAVHQAIQSLLRRRRSFQGRRIPHDWITLTVSVPPGMADTIRQMASEAQANREDRRAGRPQKPTEKAQEARKPETGIDAAADVARRLLGGLTLPQGRPG